MNMVSITAVSYANGSPDTVYGLADNKVYWWDGGNQTWVLLQG